MQTVADWLKSNPAARTYVQQWLRNSQAGSSFTQLAEYLRDNFRQSWEPGALARAIRRAYPKPFAKRAQRLNEQRVAAAAAKLDRTERRRLERGAARVAKAQAKAERERELTDAEQYERHEAKSAVQRRAAEQEKVIRELTRQNHELQKLFDALRWGIGDASVGAFTAPEPIQPLGRHGPLPEATYISAFSDAHPGALVRPREVRGLNEYSPEIFEARFERYCQGNLIMLNAARSAWDVNTFLWWWGGDLIENFLHDENFSENTLSPTEESLLLFKTLCRGIDFLLAKSDCARIRIATNNGNHGRNTKKMHATGAFLRSYEFMVYQLVYEKYKDEPRIEWNLCLGYEQVLDIYGWKLRTHHGDAIKFGGGVGGVAPALYRRIHRVNSAEYADWDLMGHFHAWGFLPRAAMNGSLIGYNAFAQRMGMPFEEPIQISWVVDAKHKMPSAMNPIFCKEIRRPTTSPR